MDKSFLYLYMCNRWWTCPDHIITARCAQVLHSRSVTCSHAWILAESLRSTYYKVIFDDGVIVFTAHDKGCVPVYVSCDGKNLSRPVPFLYKENPENKPSSRFSWFSVNGKQMLAPYQVNYQVLSTIFCDYLTTLKMTCLTAKQYNYKVIQYFHLSIFEIISI